MKIFILIVLVVLAGCEQHHDNDQDHENNTGSEHLDGLTLPSQFSYPGKNPMLGNNEMLETVITFNEKISSRDADLSSILADSVTLHLANGQNMTISSDSLQSMLRAYFIQYESINITINAAIPIVYEDLGHTWVYSWIFEELVGTDGSTESHFLHEDFRLENGKIREVFQFKRLTGN